MENIGLALKLAYPNATNMQGGDYYLVDHGDGPVVEEWRLPGQPPRNQGDVNRLLRDNEERYVEYLVQRDPAAMSVEERLEALEEMIEQQTGQTPPGLENAREVRERIRNRPDFPGRGNN